MNTYNLRINKKLILNIKDRIYGAKIVIKTENNRWAKSHGGIVIPISIESAFHEGIEGRFKMQALLNAVQNNTKSKATLLFTDWAHRHVFALKHQKRLEEAKQELIGKARAALESYTLARQQIFTNKESFLLCAQQDLLEYLAYQVLFSQRLYAFQLYPGKELSSAAYLQEQNIISMKSIYVFVSIEKKFNFYHRTS